MVKSAARVLALFELFDAERRPLTMSEVAQMMGMPQSSTSMLLKTLADAGYLERDRSGREYLPSERVSFLGNWVTQLPDRREGLPELMRRLSNATGETVLLGRQRGAHVQYLSVIESIHTLRFAPAPGTLRPMHLSAVGVMLLSELSNEKIGLLVRGWNAQRRRDQAAARLPVVMRSVAFAREHGYFESTNLATPGAGVIATPIPALVRGRRLCVGVGGPNDRVHRRRRELLSTMLELVAEFSPSLA